MLIFIFNLVATDTKSELAVAFRYETLKNWTHMGITLSTFPPSPTILTLKGGKDIDNSNDILKYTLKIAACGGF